MTADRRVRGAGGLYLSTRLLTRRSRYMLRSDIQHTILAVEPGRT